MAQTGPQNPAEEQAQHSAAEKENDCPRFRGLPLPAGAQLDAVGLNRTLVPFIDSQRRFRNLFQRTASHAFRAVSGRGLFQEQLERQRGCLQVFALPLIRYVGAVDVSVA